MLSLRVILLHSLCLVLSVVFIVDIVSDFFDAIIVQKLLMNSRHYKEWLSCSLTDWLWIYSFQWFHSTMIGIHCTLQMCTHINQCTFIRPCPRPQTKSAENAFSPFAFQFFSLHFSIHFDVRMKLIIKNSAMRIFKSATFQHTIFLFQCMALHSQCVCLLCAVNWFDSK